MKFSTTIEVLGKQATGFEVPTGVVEALGGGKRPPVTVTINGYTYRSTVASMGGRFLLPLSAEHRQGAGVAGGDEVEIELAMDTVPRQVVVPDDLADALERAPEAKAFFESLSYSNRRRYVLAVEGAKKAETRQRRIADTVAKLTEGVR